MRLRKIIQRNLCGKYMEINNEVGDGLGCRGGQHHALDGNFIFVGDGVVQACTEKMIFQSEEN